MAWYEGNDRLIDTILRLTMTLKKKKRNTNQRNRHVHTCPKKNLHTHLTYVGVVRHMKRREIGGISA